MQYRLPNTENDSPALAVWLRLKPAQVAGGSPPCRFIAPSIQSGLSRIGRSANHGARGASPFGNVGLIQKPSRTGQEMYGLVLAFFGLVLVVLVIFVEKNLHELLINCFQLGFVLQSGENFLTILHNDL